MIPGTHLAQAEGQSDLSLAQRAFEELKGRILTCELPPGTMLIAKKLAPAMGMSRTPVHEALKMLSAERLIRVIPRAGYLVSALTAQDIHDIFQLRLILEPAAVEAGMRRLTEADLDRFRTRGLDMGREPGSMPPPSADDPEFLRAAAETHDHFHREVAMLSGNQRLVDIIVGLLHASRRMTHLLTRRDTGKLDWNVFPQGHVAIARAIEARDSTAAVAAITAHVREVEQNVMASLAQDRP